MLQRTIATLTLLSIGACGGDGGVAVPETDAEACEAVPGCSEPAVPATEETAPIWRVLIERTGSGDVRIDRFEEIATPAADGTPIGPSDGSHALVALDASGTVLESRLVQFPDELHRSGYPFNDLHDDQPLDGPVNVIGFLAVDAAVDTVALVEPDGTMAFSVAAPAPGEAVRTEPGGASPLVQAAPGTHCAHVMVLEGPEDQAWSPYELAPTTPMQRAVIRAALGRLTPGLCAGVARIGFRPLGAGTGGSVTNIYGDFIGLNSELDVDGIGFDERSLVTPRAQALLQRALIHEIAHTSTHLLEAVRTNVWHESEW